MRNLKDRTIRLVLELSKSGVAIETISQACSVKRSTVEEILSGKIRPEPITRLKCPPRRCPTCGAKINAWPCVLCVRDYVYEDESEGSVGDGEKGLSGSEEKRKEEVDRWREEYGHPKENPEHPLRKRRKK